jgi:hypothetical protein
MQAINPFSMSPSLILRPFYRSTSLTCSGIIGSLWHSCNPQNFCTTVKSPSSLEERVLKDKSSLFKNYPDCPSIDIHARLSHLAYQNDVRPLLPHGWELLESESNPKDGYHGKAFEHKEHGHIVIAHRGTIPGLQSWVTNIQGIVQGDITSQQASALTFSEKIYKKAEEQRQSVSITGHSLGGWLAEIVHYHLFCEGKFSLTRVFDSPGSIPMLRNLRSNLRYQRPELNALGITSILSHPNLVNSCNEHPGLVYHVKLDLPNFTNQLEENLFYTWETHSIKRIAEALSSTVELSHRISTVTDWPVVKWQDAPAIGFLSGCRKVVKEAVSPRISEDAGTVLSALVDYLLSDRQQYDGVFKHANPSNQYDPQQADLSYWDLYKLKFQAHYCVKPFDPYLFHPNELSFKARDFFKHCKKMAQISKEYPDLELVEVDPRIQEALASCTKEGNGWKINSSKMTALDLRIYLNRYCQLHNIDSLRSKWHVSILAKNRCLEQNGKEEELKKFKINVLQDPKKRFLDFDNTENFFHVISGWE